MPATSTERHPSPKICSVCLVGPFDEDKLSAVPGDRKFYSKKTAVKVNKSRHISAVPVEVDNPRVQYGTRLLQNQLPMQMRSTAFSSPLLSDLSKLA